MVLTWHKQELVKHVRPIQYPLYRSGSSRRASEWGSRDLEKRGEK
jgi:hypothetical protein